MVKIAYGDLEVKEHLVDCYKVYVKDFDKRKVYKIVPSSCERLINVLNQDGASKFVRLGDDYIKTYNIDSIQKARVAFWELEKWSKVIYLKEHPDIFSHLKGNLSPQMQKELAELNGQIHSIQQKG